MTMKIAHIDAGKPPLIEVYAFGKKLKGVVSVSIPAITELLSSPGEMPRRYANHIIEAGMTMEVNIKHHIQLREWMLDARCDDLREIFRTDPVLEKPVPTDDIRDLIDHLQHIPGVDVIDVDTEDQVMDVYISPLYQGKRMIQREIMHDCSKWIDLFEGEVLVYFSQATGFGTYYLTGLQDGGIINKKHPDPEYRTEYEPAPDWWDMQKCVALLALFVFGRGFFMGVMVGLFWPTLFPSWLKLVTYLMSRIRPKRSS